jgi:hypothetical protein
MIIQSYYLYTRRNFLFWPNNIPACAHTVSYSRSSLRGAGCFSHVGNISGLCGSSIFNFFLNVHTVLAPPVAHSLTISPPPPLAFLFIPIPAGLRRFSGFDSCLPDYYKHCILAPCLKWFFHATEWRSLHTTQAEPPNACDQCLRVQRWDSNTSHGIRAHGRRDKARP